MELSLDEEGLSIVKTGFRDCPLLLTFPFFSLFRALASGRFGPFVLKIGKQGRLPLVALFVRPFRFRAAFAAPQEMNNHKTYKH